MQDLLTIQSVQELNHALSHQRASTRRALSELDSIGESLIPKEVPETDEVELAAKLRDREIQLLAQYAKLPTLGELQTSPELRDLLMSGTFSVAAIVGEVLLASVRGIEPNFARMHRHIMLLLLKELDDPTASEVNLVEPVLRFMRLELSDTLKGLQDEERRKLVQGMMRPLVHAMLTVMTEYRLVESPDAHGYILTELGKRTFLHLVSVQQFIDAVTAAHRALQQEVVPA